MKSVFAYLSVFATLGMIACGQQKEAESPRLVDTTRLVEETPSEVVVAPITSLRRESVDRTVSLGLPRFLQQLRVKAWVESGQFIGWEILAFRDPSAWQGVGLMRGDIVTRINQQKIERDTEAYQVFLSLRDVDMLEVEYLRGEERMKLALPIVGKKTKSQPE